MPSATTTVRVRYAETDAMGVAHHANYFVWFEVGRSELMRGLGWSYRDMEDQAGVRLPVIQAACDYLQPVRYDDELWVRTQATLLSGVRLAFDYELLRPSDGAVLARGRTVHAAVNGEGRPCRLPERARMLLS